jgi:integrase
MAIHRIPFDPKGKELARLMRTKGKHSDGGGLYLQVASEGQGSWVFRHKERWKCIGPANAYTPNDAREKARLARVEVAEGRDPFISLASRRAQAVGATFGEWLAKYLNKKEAQWTPSNRARERRDHERTFSQIPEFTALSVSAIDRAAKADALDKLGKSARRKATSWIEAVVTFAQTGVVRQRGPNGDDDTEHHDAMPWAKVPDFYKRIAELDSVDARALCFTILTSARTDEVIGRKEGGDWVKAPANWSEIANVDGQPTWIIPGRTDDGENFRGMKAKKTHRVPLSTAAVALLGDRRADDVPLFKVSSDNAMRNTLKANDGNGYTVHGFRSSFEDWGAEATSYPRDLIKLCTGHDTRTKTDKAYQRSDLLEKRREIMQRWSDFAAGDIS